MTAFRTEGFELVKWQRDAVEAWVAGNDGDPFRGTLEIFTGGGKTLISMVCAEHASAQEPEMKLAVVVPTEALAHQWVASVEKYSSVTASEIGLLGAGGKATLEDHRVLISVLNTAAKRLPQLAASSQPLMLVVDECHRAGAPRFSRVLDTPAEFRLGLSATPGREELDEDGEPLRYDEQLVGKSLGGVVYGFSLRDARHHGWLPDYEIHHHGAQLHAAERQRYDRVSREVEDLAERLRAAGGDRSRAQQLQSRQDDLGQAARAYVAATAQRKDLLYRAPERARIADAIVRDELETDGGRRILLFHERVDEAVELYEHLSRTLDDVQVGLEHSRLPDATRARTIARFRTGDCNVLVSVKSLVEGIDVPDADVGISVAASSSVRQRIQSLGRVLRRRFDGSTSAKHARMHVLYVSDTVDELIYSKEDWSDLTGEAANRYFRWPLEPDLRPEPQDGPPASPKPTEEEEWARLGSTAPVDPTPWLGAFLGQEYSVDTLGTVTNSFGTIIANPQNAADLIKAVRGRQGGRFRVTPAHRLVLVRADGANSTTYIAGQLPMRFVAASEPNTATPLNIDALQPGMQYDGSVSKSGGTFKLRQKRGGLIERKGTDGTEFAITEGESQGAENARRVLAAWQQVIDRGITFHVNDDDDAWYTDAGMRRFLARVPGGFCWPTKGD